MDNIPVMNGSCPHCGKEIKGYMPTQSDYGSPIITCKGCGKKYLDKRWHEIEIEGIPLNALSCKGDFKIALIGLGIAAVSAFFTILFLFLNNTYSLKAIVVIFGGMAIFLYAVIDAICIKTGVKQKRFDKLRAESAKRLQNKDYAKQLAELGYNVPKQYL